MKTAVEASLTILALAGFTVFVPCDGCAAGADKAGSKAVDVRNTAMGRLAATMKPGEMKKLETGNYNRQLLKSWYDWEKNLRGSHKGYSVISWSNDANWDPVTRQVFYFGLGHYASPKFVKYAADTNEWKLLDLPKWADKRKNKEKKWPVGHTYDLETIVPHKRLFLVKWRHVTHVYHIDSGKWTQRPSGAGKWTKAASTPMEYFQEMKGLVLVGDRRALVHVDVETWKTRSLGKVPAGIHGVMEYNPVHKVMLVGGGDGGKQGHRSFSLVDAQGRITRLKKAAPIHVRCTPECKLTCDPVSGDYLAQGRGAKKMYAFHPLKDEWKVLDVKAPAGVAVQIPECGVVMFCGTWGGVWLYKHKSPWTDKQTLAEGKAK